MHRILLPIFLTAALSTPTFAQDAAPAPAPARSEDARIAALEAQVAALQAKIDAMTAKPAAPAPDEMPGMKMGGHESGSGPSVTVSGNIETQFTTALSGSLKQPIFGGTKNTDFILTHAHPMIHAALSDKADADLMWCLTHVGSTAVYEADVSYAATPALTVKAGRWILPFGAWNPISNASQFPTVSRPLMYLGHEERNEVLIGGPQPILNDEDSDIGLLANGQTSGKIPISYAAWIGNGKGDTYQNFPGAWIDFRPSEDNNGSKSPGGRLATTFGKLTLGASATGGKWDQANQFRYSIRGLDATWRVPNNYTLRAEYTDNPINGAGPNGSRIRRRGWYAMADKELGAKWTAVAMYSAETERPAANVEKVSRATLGLDYRLADTVTLKSEIGRLFIGPYVGDPENAPLGTDFHDITSLKFSTVVSF